jgi:hypothetical protein
MQSTESPFFSLEANMRLFLLTMGKVVCTLMLGILLSFAFLHFCHSRTHSDTLNAKFDGEYALLKAAIEGDLHRLQIAIQRHPNVDCVLTEEIGERYLKLGKVGVDFPIAPVLHLAISGGTQNHLRVAHRLLLAGADINYFNFTRTQSDSNFPPPIYFGLGAFGYPTPAHSGILYAIFRAFGERFRYDTIVTWVKISRYPPPLHTCVLFNNIDGIFFLSSLPNYDMNERDHESLSALHVAAWLGNFVQVSFLLQNGADPLAKDSYNRTFLHYCAIRGLSSLPANILNRPSALSLPIKKSLVSAVDSKNMTALDIARLPPAQSRFIESIEQFLDLHSSDDETWQMIISLNSSALTAGQFRDFQMTQRPVKLIGNFTSSLKIWSIITNRTLFIERYGPLVVDIESNSTLERDNIEGFLKRKEFCLDSEVHLSSCFKPHATANSTLKNPLCLDFESSSINNFFDACPLLASVNLRIFTGFISGLSLRSHSAAWNVLLEGGPRRWHFISPGAALDLILPFGELDPDSKFDRENPLKPELQLGEWESQILPLLRKSKVVASVMQRLGDVIYIPHGWSYVVIGADGDIDATTTICESSSQSVFHQVPIGVRLYGSQIV